MRSEMWETGRGKKFPHPPLFLLFETRKREREELNLMSPRWAFFLLLLLLHFSYSEREAEDGGRNGEVTLTFSIYLLLAYKIHVPPYIQMAFF